MNFDSSQNGEKIEDFVVGYTDELSLGSGSLVQEVKVSYSNWKNSLTCFFKDEIQPNVLMTITDLRKQLDQQHRKIESLTNELRQEKLHAGCIRQSYPTD